MLEELTTWDIRRGSRELFNSLTEWDLELHVAFGVDTKRVVNGVGIVIFQFDSGGRLEIKYVLWVPELKWSSIAISIIGKGLCVVF